jgi:hypothetical protein
MRSSTTAFASWRGATPKGCGCSRGTAAPIQLGRRLVRDSSARSAMNGRSSLASLSASYFRPIVLSSGRRSAVAKDAAPQVRSVQPVWSGTVRQGAASLLGCAFTPNALSAAAKSCALIPFAVAKTLRGPRQNHCSWEPPAVALLRLHLIPRTTRAMQRRSRPSQDTLKDRLSIHERPKKVDARR